MSVTRKLLDNVVAGAAVRDKNGKRIDTQYATASDLSTANTNISNLSSGKVNKSDVVDNLTSTGETQKPLSANQGYVLKGLIDNINSLLGSDDTDLDTLQEVVAYIKNNKSLIDGITTNKVSVSDIIDNLTSEISNKPLSAKQGKALKALIDTTDGNVSTLSTTVSGHTTSISGLAGDISAEETRAKAVEGGLDTRVGTLEGQVVTLDNSVSSSSNNGVKASGIYTYFDDRGLTTVSSITVADWEE